ncbi:predicted protein [Clavispora lusitaniae ATCC 42720]|uniref:Uncharacterized protein n=1 Tax=Clavispora lusitaniae (strain ATCC 42720) TaxID=306902 RepID=C4Y9N1_CLAL4|nr:uncharacterized protein CLUG_04921 [Clavispora lusitaniae ATCC 42720]EEQ40793.1 predicted protein [Clavispora lusitaniae ATCC 42720]
MWRWSTCSLPLPRGACFKGARSCSTIESPRALPVCPGRCRFCAAALARRARRRSRGRLRSSARAFSTTQTAPTFWRMPSCARTCTRCTCWRAATRGAGFCATRRSTPLFGRPCKWATGTWRRPPRTGSCRAFRRRHGRFLRRRLRRGCGRYSSALREQTSSTAWR